MIVKTIFIVIWAVTTYTVGYIRGQTSMDDVMSETIETVYEAQAATEAYRDEARELYDLAVEVCGIDSDEESGIFIPSETNIPYRGKETVHLELLRSEGFRVVPSQAVARQGASPL